MKSLVHAMVSVSAFTALSRVAGFVRDMMTAAIMGAGGLSDAYFVALRLPNFFRRITAEGAFSVSFVPLYSQKMEREGEKAADDFASHAFFLMLFILGLFTLIAIIFMPWIVRGIAPGFGANSAQHILAVELSRITFPYLLCMSLASLLGGALNVRGWYAPFAIAPFLFNITLIAALCLVVLGVVESPGYAQSCGIAAAGVIQLGLLYICAWRVGVRLRWVYPCFDVDIRKLFTLMGPGIIGAGVMHINLFADMIMGSFLQSGSISWLYYADRLQQLPLSTIGIALGTALLPMLSRAVSGDRAREARDLLGRALIVCFLLALPAAVGLFTLAVPIMSVLFERGAFGPTDVAATAQVLAAYAVGLPAYVAIKVLSTACWARQDTTTPVKAAIASTVLNIALGLAFILGLGLGVKGIAMATSIAGWVQAAFLVRALHKQGHNDVWATVGIKLFKITLSSLIMALGLWLTLDLMPTAPHSSFWLRAGGLISFVVGGAALYGVGIIGMGVVKPRTILYTLRP